MRATRSRPLIAMIAAACLAASGCNGATPTTPTTTPSKKPVTIKDGGGPGATPASGLTTPAASYFGRVLGIDGKPAVGVEVRAYVIANNGGSLVTDNGAGLVTDSGAGLLSNNSGSYKLAQAAPTSARTDAKGEFKLDLPAGQTANLEAVLSEDVKAIRGGVTAASKGVELQLAFTGTISGKVTTPAARRITDYTGVDIFIPGTSYGAKAASDGAFTISNVPVGSYKLFANKVGIGQAISTTIKVASKTDAKAGDITLALEPLAIMSVSPGTAIEGQEVTLTGERFGASTGGILQVLVGTSVVPAAQRDSDTVIRFKVPAGVASGAVTVLVNGLPSDSKPLAIAKDFTLSAPRAGVALPAGAQALTIVAHDAAGAALAALPPLTWSITAGPEVASVDQAGKLTPLKAGQVTVRAAAGALVADLRIKVLAQAPAVGSVLGGVASELIGTLGGLAIAPAGSLYVANYGNVLKLAAGATAPTAHAGNPINKEGDYGSDPADGPGADATFSAINGMVTGPDGTLWVCDSETIRSISPTGEVTTHAGDPGNVASPRDGVGGAAIISGASHPVLSNGQLYFIDEPAIRRLDPASDTVTTVIKNVSEELTGLAAAADGKVYALVGGNLRLLDGNKLITPPAAYRLTQAEVVAEPGAEVDELNAAADEAATDAKDEETDEFDTFESPAHLVRTPDGTFYATKSAAIVKRVGINWTVVAGGSGVVPKDGPGTAAGFSSLITGMLLGPDGALYVLDEGAVRKVDLQAAGIPVTTLLRSGSDLASVRAKKPALK